MLNIPTMDGLPGAMFMVVAFFLLLLVRPGESVLPGAQVRISQKGLDYVAKKAIENLQIQGERIDDQHGKDRVAGGKVEYDITGTVVRSFGKPTSKVIVSPGKGITVSATGATASIHGDWRYKYRLHFIKIRDHGSFDVTASGVDFSVSFILGRDSNGRPNIKTTGCSSNVGGLKVKFHGGASWLYNLFKRSIAKSLKRKLGDLMCKAATKGINVDAEKKLAEINMVSDVGHNPTLVLDYRLTQAPVFGQGYMDVMLKGEFSWKTAPSSPPFQPGPLPQTTDASKMLYIWGSEYVVNSFIYTVYKHQLLRANVSKSDFRKGDGDFLNMTCSGLSTGCMGNFLYQASLMYPDASVIIDMGANEVPNVTITPDGIKFHAQGIMSLFADSPKKGKHYMLKLQVSVAMQINAWIDGTVLKGKVTSMEPRIEVLDSKVGKISEMFLNKAFKLIADKYITKQINKLGEKGIDIPNIKDCKYINPVLKLNKGNLMIATDLSWSPSKVFKFRSVSKKGKRNDLL